MAVDQLWRENTADHNAVQYRQMLDGLAGWRPHAHGAAATSGDRNGGVLHPDACEVTERGAGANMSVDVAVGGAILWGTAGSGSTYRGAYFAYIDAVENVAISAADATNPRIDLVGLRIRDTAYAEAANDVAVVVVTGTPAGSPAEPSVPDNFLTLARVDVPALDTAIGNAQITDRRKQWVANGGVIRVANATDLAAIPNPWDGQVALVASDSGAGNQPTIRHYNGANAAWEALGWASRSWTFIAEALPNAATVSFTSIPATFRDLRIILHARGNAAVTAGFVILRINSDTGGNYDDVYHGEVSASGAQHNYSEGSTSYNSFPIPGTSGTANRAGSGEMLFANYRGTTFQKSLCVQGGFNDGGVGHQIYNKHGGFRSTSAISRIDLHFNAISTGFVNNSVFTLEGRR